MPSLRVYSTDLKRFSRFKTRTSVEVKSKEHKIEPNGSYNANELICLGKDSYGMYDHNKRFICVSNFGADNAEFLISHGYHIPPFITKRQYVSASKAQVFILTSKINEHLKLSHIPSVEDLKLFSKDDFAQIAYALEDVACLVLTNSDLRSKLMQRSSSTLIQIDLLQIAENQEKAAKIILTDKELLQHILDAGDYLNEIMLAHKTNPEIVSLCQSIANDTGVKLELHKIQGDGDFVFLEEGTEQDVVEDDLVLVETHFKEKAGSRRASLFGAPEAKKSDQESNPAAVKTLPKTRRY